jgi:Ubiquitin family
MSPLILHVAHRGVNYDLSLSPDDTLDVLYTHLESLTAVPVSRQKLLYKGKKPSHTSTSTLKDAGLSHGIKVTMLGSTDQELGTMIKAENEQRRIEQVMQDRASKGTVKARRRLATMPHAHNPS